MHKKIEQTAQIFDSWDNAVILLTQSGVIASWNKGARDLYGYSADEVVGREYSFLVPFDVKDETFTMFKKVQAGMAARNSWLFFLSRPWKTQSNGLNF